MKGILLKKTYGAVNNRLYVTCLTFQTVIKFVVNHAGLTCMPVRMLHSVAYFTYITEK